MEVETHSLSPTFELIHLLSQSTTDTYFPPNNAANQPSLGHATAVLKLQKVGKGLSKDAIAQKCWLSSIGSKLLIHDIAMDITYNTTIKNGVKQMLQEREQYEYIVREDKIINKQYGDLFHTNEDSEDAKWIFVMSTSKKLYAGKKKKGLFHHSSFLAGGATLAAGRLVAENEILKSISAYSGHYRPTDDTLDGFLSYLKENVVKLDEVEVIDLHWVIFSTSEVSSIGKMYVPEISEGATNTRSSVEEDPQSESVTYSRTLSGGLQSPRAVVPKTAILQRINSKKASKSYQLGHQLSLNWSTILH
ncbi:hypothetical protein JHK87_007793 [Glycine soja]|nr:hypothetical protein JHK87_007793 [Glycine soja]